MKKYWLTPALILSLLLGVVIGKHIDEPTPLATVSSPSPTTSPVVTEPVCKRRERTIDNLRILVNEERLKAGKKQAYDSPMLFEYAEYRLDELTTTDTFTHETKERFWDWAQNRNRLTEARQFELAGGENISRYGSTACDIVEGWLASPTHRDAMLSIDTTAIGIAINGRYAVLTMAKGR